MTKIMIDEAVVRLALDRLQSRTDTADLDAIAAINEALVEQQERGEPVAWMITTEMQDGSRSTYPVIGRYKDVKDMCDFGEPVPLVYGDTTPLAPAQEPVAWVDVKDTHEGPYDFHGKELLPVGKHNLYTTPPAPAQPLTDEQIVQVLGDVREAVSGNVFLTFARAIEAAHGITSGFAKEKGN